MRIVSPFHDYYDSALRHGQSSTQTFIRKTVDVLSKDESPFAKQARADYAFLFAGLPNVSSRRIKSGDLHLRPFAVGFCGTVYRGVRMQYSPSYYLSAECESETVLYDAEAFVAELLERGVRGPHIASAQAQPCADIESFLRSAPAQNRQVFETRRDAVVLVKRPTRHEGASLSINPALKSVEFFKKLDAWQAFQELEMFLGAIAAPENKPPVEIEDKYRIAQHGFDRYSFRKAPTKRRHAAA